MNDKQELRRRMRRLRAAISAAERAQAGERLAAVVTRSSFVHTGDVLAAFAAFGSEIPTGPLIEGLRALGKRVLLPRVHPSAPRMDLCEFTQLDALGADRFGIPTPDGPAYDGRVDAIFVPGLAFGLDGSRLGYGAGFYDRFLAERPPPHALCGLGFAVQVVERAPSQPHDIRLTHIATPERIIVCAHRAR